MNYARIFTLNLGSGYAGTADLRAQLLDTDGNDSGSEISTGFAEIGNGIFLFYKEDFADTFRGAIKFYQDALPAVILGITSINPEEFIDIKILRQKSLNKVTFNRTTKVETVYEDDAVTPAFTQTWEDDGTTQTQGVKT